MDAPEALRRWRGKRTLREAADEVGCDPSYLSLLENRKKIPSDRKLSLALERIAGIPLEAWDEQNVHGVTMDDTLMSVKTPEPASSNDSTTLESNQAPDTEVRQGLAS